MLAELERACDALQACDPACSRDEWVRLTMAAKAGGVNYDTVAAWSARAENYNARDLLALWKGIKVDGAVKVATLYKIAAQQGWRPGPRKSRRRPSKVATLAVPSQAAACDRADAVEVWARCTPASPEHGYIVLKKGHAAGLRVVPEKDPLKIAGQSMAGALVVPVMALSGSPSEPVSLHFIAPPEMARRWKAKDTPSKLSLPGAAMDGAFIVGELKVGATVFVVEGIGQAWACTQATGLASVVAFGWGRVRAVSAELRQRDPSARLVVVPDVGKEAEAEKVAREVAGLVATMPAGWERNSDVNDLVQRDGLAVLTQVLSDARPPAFESRLNVVFADELPSSFTPPDELIQGVLSAEGGSVLYGDSNSGKTFLAIDMAASLSRGVPWMGRQTEPGLVVYLAVESPASVCSRLQAYQSHHGVTVPNFAIVQSPIDLFEADADTDAIIQLVRQLEAQRGQRVRLIVGDTLARLSAGANENAGQDMGLVVRRFDRIRRECKAHFLLVHHSGKAAAAGARGWSGIRAAIDTEIEVTDGPAGRCAEITKQRDLSTKGQRIGFSLDPVLLGSTKWGAPATSCVVLPSGTPIKVISKRMGRVEDAVIQFLAVCKVATRKRDIAAHLADRFEKGPVYRAMQKLVDAAAIHQDGDLMSAAAMKK